MDTTTLDAMLGNAELAREYQELIETNDAAADDASLIWLQMAVFFADDKTAVYCDPIQTSAHNEDVFANLAISMARLGGVYDVIGTRGVGGRRTRVIVDSSNIKYVQIEEVVDPNPPETDEENGRNFRYVDADLKGVSADEAATNLKNNTARLSGIDSHYEN